MNSYHSHITVKSEVSNQGAVWGKELFLEFLNYKNPKEFVLIFLRKLI